MLHRKKIAALFIGIIITLSILAFSWNKVFTTFTILPRLNNILYDINLKIFHKTLLAAKSGSNVIIADIDEKSLAAEGKWPWPRNKIAELVGNLQSAGAAVIAFDVLFPERDMNAAKIVLDYSIKHNDAPKLIQQYLMTNEENFDNDKILAQTLTHGDTVLAIFFHNDLYHSVGELGKPSLRLNAANRLIVPQLQHYTGIIAPLLAAAQHAGFVTTIPDSDGLLRRSPLFIKYDNALYPSLALEAAQLFLLQDKVSLVTSQLGDNEIMLGANLGNTYIPTDSSGNVLIPYRGPAFSFPYISATDILHDNFSAKNLAGKIVIIGSSAVGIGDTHAMPLQSAAYPGCEVHANIIETILSKNFLSSPLWIIGLERVLIVIIGLGLSLFAMYYSVLGLFAATLGGELLVFLLQAWLWVRWHLVLPYIILPHLLVLALGVFNMGYGYLFETRYRFKLRNLYGQYVAAEHIDNMLDNPKQYNLLGHSKEMSVLFADIRGFTSISEKLDAGGVKKFLNNLFTPLTKIIFENQGTIDKYVGDMVMAFWNDPVADAKHAHHTTVAALQMVAKVRELAPLFAQQGITDVRIGVGINSGLMNVGDMGSEYRKAYTVLGDAVNLASRLESSNKFYGTSILVSEATQKYCHDIVFRFIDKVRVKGKKEAIKLYEPICFTHEMTAELQNELQQYENALALYYAREWNKTYEILQKLIAQSPHHLIYQIYLARVNDFANLSPPVEWDGVYTRTEK